jgi:hypothetical protein
MKFSYFFFFLILINQDVVFSSSSEIKKKKLNDTTKIRSNTEAILEEVGNSQNSKNNFVSNTKVYFRKIFPLDSSLNQCNIENCEYCCLSLNFCGSKEQCENSKFTQNILKIIFYFVCFILMAFIIYKIYITDSHPKQEDYEKIDDQSLNILIGLFIQNKENRRKMKM